MGYFVVEVYVAWCIDKVECILFFIVWMVVIYLYGVIFNGNVMFLFQVYVVQGLVFYFLVGNCFGIF